MAKHLTTKDIDILINLIDVWEGKITWDALCDEGAKLIGTRPTRQTLNSHEKIKIAYQNRKDNIKSNFVSSKRPASLSIAEQRIRRLEAENDRLKNENERLIEKFVRWQYNSYKHGINKDKLDAALPFVDRDSSS